MDGWVCGCNYKFWTTTISAFHVFQLTFALLSVERIIMKRTDREWQRLSDFLAALYLPLELEENFIPCYQNSFVLLISCFHCLPFICLGLVCGSVCLKKYVVLQQNWFDPVRWVKSFPIDDTFAQISWHFQVFRLMRHFPNLSTFPSFPINETFPQISWHFQVLRLMRHYPNFLTFPSFPSFPIDETFP